jgi:TIR domain-containing protein
MPRFFTKTILDNKDIKEARKNLAERKSQAELVVFVSHSHKDKELVSYVEGLVSHAIGSQAQVYVDWRDPSMPKVTSAHTAEVLKEKIRASSCIIGIMSETALKSTWVPWELGFGDGVLASPRIAVLPIASEEGNWNGSGSEYLGLYPQILNDSYFRINPVVQDSSDSISLADWLLYCWRQRR